jgi:L-aspartate oxidase
MCGGVVTDLDSQTQLPGLLAAGEVAHTGMHGANRLASNSLLEAVVMAGRAVASGRKARRSLGPVPREPAWSPAGAVRVREAIILEHDWNSVRALMSDYVGIVRADERLRVAAGRMRALRESIQEYFNRYLLTPDLVELRNLALVAELIIACARMRTESRGLHYNLDHPDRDDDHWLRDSVVSKHGDRT